MDSPVWSNDLLYVKELIIILIVSVALIGICFYVSKRDDRKHTVRAARVAASQPADTTDATPPDAEQTSQR